MALSDETDLDMNTAMCVEDTLQRRDANTSVVVQLADWAPDYDIAQTCLLAAGDCTDYSDDAVLLESAVAVNLAAMREQTLADLTSEYLTNLLTTCQNEYTNDRGATFVPKSAIEEVVDVSGIS
jgi:hypothetical protein